MSIKELMEQAERSGRTTLRNTTDDELFTLASAEHRMRLPFHVTTKVSALNVEWLFADTFGRSRNLYTHHHE